MKTIQRLWVACIAVTICARVAAQSSVVTTFAGASGHGYADGANVNARFGLIQDVAVDSDGNLYAADYENCVVRKVAPDGTVSTLAGLPGVSGARDGTGSAARFRFLFGLAVDASKNVYVADSGNHTIRKITPTGVVTTLAGSTGNAGTTDGTGSSARFNGPRGVAVDRSGNLYVTDTGNYVIRKITPEGVVTTMAGLSGNPGTADGVASVARFSSPYGVSVDAAGNVYVAENVTSTIRRISPDGTVLTLAGTAGMSGTANGTGSAARFSSPSFIEVDDAGNVYVPDRSNHTIRKVSPTGVVTTLAGGSRGFLDGTGSGARFTNPTGVALDPSGTVYIADTYNFAIRKLSPSGAVTTYAGQAGRGATDGVGSSAQFFAPRGVAFDAQGNLIVADSYNHTIRRITPAGKVTTLAGSPGVQGAADGQGSTARFTFPYGVAVDSAGIIYVADSTNHTIRTVTPDGVVSTIAGAARELGSTNGVGNTARFTGPADVAVDKAGNVFVAELGNAIRRITPDGTVSTFAGSIGTAGYADGAAANARFNIPFRLAFDRSGNLLVAEMRNHTIRKITPAGVVSTIAGHGGISGFADGKGTAALFDTPNGLAVDGDDNIYVVDSANFALRKISPTGDVSTLAGDGNGGYGDGLRYDATFFYPDGVAVDANGNLYVTDTSNHVVRKVQRTGIAVPGSRLFNLSVRANLVAGQPLIAGFVVDGGAKSLLVRGVGPGLAPFLPGLTVAGNPKVEIYNAQSTMVQANDDWAGASALAAAFGAVGAFPLASASLDAAALRDIQGLHTAQMSTTASGIGLIETYDAGSGYGTRVINLSARYHVGTGADSLVAGFVIEGTTPKTVLIRGVGPTLASYGVTNFLADPKLELYDSREVKVAENDNWPVSLTSTYSAVGAVGLASNSKDAALLVSLMPGLYTAQLKGADGGSGQGVIEVYEVAN
jgi:sugar lactone lactonase YvrE